MPTNKDHGDGRVRTWVAFPIGDASNFIRKLVKVSGLNASQVLVHLTYHVMGLPNSVTPHLAPKPRAFRPLQGDSND